MCLQPYPQTVLAACQNETEPPGWLRQLPSTTKQELTEAHLTWPQVFLSQNCTTKALVYHFTTFFTLPPKTQLPPLKIIPNRISYILKIQNS